MRKGGKSHILDQPFKVRFTFDQSDHILKDDLGLIQSDRGVDRLIFFCIIVFWISDFKKTAMKDFDSLRQTLPPAITGMEGIF